MGCSWTDLLDLAGWEYARPDATQTLAFIYAASVSLLVEEWCFGLNPDLQYSALNDALTKEPDWVNHRKEWLKTGWPRHEAATKADLELFGLVRAKAYLAAGSKIPDGTASEMSEAFAKMFPEVIATSHGNSCTYQSWEVSVTVDADGRAGCGWRIAREGEPLPLANERIGNRSAFDILLANQIRISIQRQIEALTA